MGWLIRWSSGVGAIPMWQAGRFCARRRHPGHGDDHRSDEELVRQFEEQGRLGPVGFSRLVVVDTMNEVAVDDVVSKIRDLDHDERRLQ
jgi:hypothetical protein